MTDANHIQWDLAQQALVNALADVAVLHSATRDTMRHTPSRNRMVMAMNAIDHAIDVLVESAGTVTAEAERRAEDDAVNGAFYREIDNWNMRRGGAQ
jgi:hypothetical protein